MSIAFGTQLIGQTEKALNAILDRHLTGTGITEPQWVTLTLTVLGQAPLTRDALTERAAHALKTTPATVHERLAELTAAGLLHTTPGGAVEVTEHGKAQWNRVRAAITQTTQTLWGDLPPDDLAIAGRVLNTVLSRANALLPAA